MAFSTPPNFVAGAVLTEANLDVLSDDISFLAGPPRCRVYNSANISIATSGVAQALTFNSERFDTDTMHSTAVNTSRITFTTGGTYLIGGCVAFATNATGSREIYVRLNGATVVGDTQVPANSAVATNLSVTTLYSVSAGDYAELYATQYSGGALDVVAVGNFTPEFWAIWQGL